VLVKVLPPWPDAEAMGESHGATPAPAAQAS
jgi:hypothetical protein